jgi:hypothetical protein
MSNSRTRTPILSGVMLLVSATLYGYPPTTGAQWWSTNPNLECASMHSLIYEIPLAMGGTGYACGVTGTFVWWAAGGGWETSIRTAAPGSGAIGIQYVFYDGDGSPIALDTISASSRASGNTVSLVLSANQPTEVQLLGASSDAPQYNTTQTGSVFGIFLCPDPATCATVLPQLLYSSLPLKPWSLSVPIAWDSSFSFLQPSGLSTRWSAVGINDATHVISFAIYNQSAMPASYTVRVYDSNGSLAGQATTPLVPGINGVGGVTGTRGFLLTDVIRTALPAGILKVTVEASTLSSALFLQFNGDSATSLQVTSDVAPGTSTGVAAAR